MNSTSNTSDVVLFEHTNSARLNVLQKRPPISVVIPTLNESAYIGRCLASVEAALPDAEIVVVDGGSTDSTRARAAERGVKVCSVSKGRGPQCNAGSRMASGDLLMFLHADTTLPLDAMQMITEGFRDPATQVAMFRLSFDEVHPLLKFYSFFTRFDSPWFKFGDQAIIVRRDLFSAVDGFPEWPLFEDVEFLRKARMHSTVRILPASVTCSSRRLRRDGLVRRQIRNAWLLLQFRLGASPFALAKEYNSEHTS